MDDRIEVIQTVIDEIEKRCCDRRLQVVDVKIAKLEGNRLGLRGRVLDQETLAEVQQRIAVVLPEAEFDLREMQVLRQTQNELSIVATNITGLFAAPSWQAEMLSQLLSGQSVEILERQEKWAFVRQPDGYLGWAYLPYLTEFNPEPPDHICKDAALIIYERPVISAPIVSRIYAGSEVQVVGKQEEWRQIRAHCRGWVKRHGLTALKDMPQSGVHRRWAISTLAISFTGAPYLWGGVSVNGIDCSGLAMLAYRLAGVAIPRDADLQFNAGVPVDAPFQPGDLLFFCEPDDQTRISHVGISMGGWDIIHSSRARNGVYWDNVQEVEHLRSTFAGTRTFIE